MNTNVVKDDSRKNLVEFIIKNQRWLNAGSSGDLIRYSQECLEEMGRDELKEIIEEIRTKRDKAYERIDKYYLLKRYIEEKYE